MTRPGSPPTRGRHAAPDGGARPDEDAALAGRHAAPEPPPSRHAAPELGYHDPTPRRRRHAARDDDATRYGDPAAAFDGHGYAAASAPPAADRYGHAGPERLNGYPADQRPAANGHRRPELPGDPAVEGYVGPRPDQAGEPPAGRYRYAPPDSLHEPPVNGLGPARPDQAGAPPVNGLGHVRPDQAGAPPVNGYRYPRSEPVDDPPADGFGYAQPEGAGGYRAPVLPWPDANGYHLDRPAAPTVNGYRLDEPVPPVTGFPYTAPPPDAPVAYPLNGHGVDAAERDAASWPVNGHATGLDGHAPLTGWQREPFRPAYPPGPPPDAPVAVVPLDDEATQTLGRPAEAPDRPADRAATQPEHGRPKPLHPPRAVIRRRRARRRALEWPFLIVFAVVSAFLIRQYVVQTFYIPSASMHETLVEGDRVLVNKVSYHLHDVHRGDVVVFRKPPNLAVSEDDLIKRVVALPGETVQGRGGKVYVNGAPLDEPYVEPLCHGTGDFGPTRVPAGALWVMGDNRCNSSDSRVFGPIKENLVVGRASVLAWPLDRLSWL
jgi:signal peptidase I